MLQPPLSKYNDKSVFRMGWLINERSKQLDRTLLLFHMETNHQNAVDCNSVNRNEKNYNNDDDYCW